MGIFKRHQSGKKPFPLLLLQGGGREWQFLVMHEVLISSHHLWTGSSCLEVK